MSGGAIDNEFEDAEKDAETLLTEHLDNSDGLEHAALQSGDIAFDLVTRQPLFVAGRKADTLVEYFKDEEFDLLTYKQHKFLPVRIDDPVFECVFIGDIEGLHSFSDTYDYPAGRLARVPVYMAGGDD